MTAREHHQKEANEENEQQLKNERLLVLHNDDYHTFDYVIEALVEVCKHDEIQAEQCTLLIHYKGKCDVKKGSLSFLRPFRRALVQRDLKATID